MAANLNPIFVESPKSPTCRASVANTARDGTGTLATLVTAGPDGAFYPGWRWQAEGTTTAGFIRLFLQDGGSGNNELKKEMPVAAITPVVGTTPPAEGEWYPQGGIWLSPNSVLKVGTHIGEPFGSFAEGGGDY